MSEAYVGGNVVTSSVPDVWGDAPFFCIQTETCYLFSGHRFGGMEEGRAREEPESGAELLGIHPAEIVHQCYGTVLVSIVCAKNEGVVMYPIEVDTWSKKLSFL